MERHKPTCLFWSGRQAECGQGVVRPLDPTDPRGGGSSPGPGGREGRQQQARPGRSLRADPHLSLPSSSTHCPHPSIRPSDPLSLLDSTWDVFTAKLPSLPNAFAGVAAVENARTLHTPWMSGEAHQSTQDARGRQACGTHRGSRLSPRLAVTQTLTAEEGSPRTRRKGGSSTGPFEQNDTSEHPGVERS